MAFGNPMHGRLVKLLQGTPAELALEPAIAALGIPYRFQFPCWMYRGGLRYFPDFLLPSLSLVIEVDDKSHRQKTEEDAQRSADLLRVHGWKVVRCSNEDALRRPYETVERLTGMKCREPEGGWVHDVGLPELAPKKGRPAIKTDTILENQKPKKGKKHA